MTKLGDATMRVLLSNVAIKIKTFSPFKLDARNVQDRQVRRKDRIGQNSELPK